MSNDENILLRKYQLSVHLSPKNQHINTEANFDNGVKFTSDSNARSLNSFFKNLTLEVDHGSKSYSQSNCEKNTSTSEQYSYISQADSINLHQINDIQESNTDSRCTLLAIPIPHSILEEVDAKINKPLDSLNDDNSANELILSNLLSCIHPALNCLHPCVLLRSNTSETMSDDVITCIPQNTFQLLVLSVIHPVATANNKFIQTCFSRNNELDALKKIMNEINGEPMVMMDAHNPSAVIQAIPISQMIFLDHLDEENSCKNEYIVQDEFQKFAKSDPFSSTSDCSSRRYDDDSTTKPVWVSKDTILKEKKGATLDGKVMKRWDTKDEEILGEITSISSVPELPLCPVCIFRIEPQRLGLPHPKQYHRCSHRCDQIKANNQASFCNNMEFLSPWSWPSYCRTCHVLQERLTLSGAKPFFRFASQSHAITVTDFATNNPYRNVRNQLKCYKCGIEETLWVCLTCSVVGCGRYSHGHAKQHFHRTCHPFSLELATQRIWDYKTSSFIQRDDLLNCPFMQGLLGATNRAAYHGATLGTDEACCGGRVPTRQRRIETAPKKAVMVGEEYEALLQSVLEDQAEHYHGEISRLRADLTSQDIDKADMSKEEVMEVETLEAEISKLRVEVDHMSNRAMEAHAQEAGHREKSNSLLREQGVVKQILDRVREDAVKEQEQGKKVVEGLELEISDLTTYLHMRQQVAQNEELSNAQICGTSEKKKHGGKKKGLRKARK